MWLLFMIWSVGHTRHLVTFSCPYLFILFQKDQFSSDASLTIVYWTWCSMLSEGVPNLDNNFLCLFCVKIKIYGNDFSEFYDEPELIEDCISERAQERNRFLAFRLDPLSYALLLAKWERNIIWEYEKYTIHRIREIHSHKKIALSEFYKTYKTF